MEPLGAAASILTITEVVKIAIELQHRLEEAPLRVEKAIDRVRSLGEQVKLLLEFQERIAEADVVAQRYQNLLTGCCREMTTLRNTLALTVRARSCKRIRWAIIGHARAKEVITELAHVESSLNLAFTMLQCERLQLLYDITSTLSQDMARVAPCSRHSKFYPQCCNRSQSPDRRASKSLSARETLCRWNFSCLALSKATVTAVCLRHRADPTILLSMRIALLAKLIIGLELSGSILNFRIDTFALTLNRCVASDDPFLLACIDGNATHVQELLVESPTRITYSDADSRTALSIAIQAGHFDICRLLIDHGAKVAPSFGRHHTSALSWALQHKRMDIARLLIKEGCQFDHISDLGWSPIFYLWPNACPQPGVASFLNMLRSHGDFSLLHHGIVDNDGWTVLARCAVFGSPEDTLTLIRYGVDPLETDPDSKWTALHYVVFHGVTEAFHSIFPEYERLGDIEMPDFTGWTLLHLAVQNGNATIIRHLLESGADWKAETLPWGEEDIPASIREIPVTALQIASAYGDQRYLDLLDMLDELGFLRDEDSQEDTWIDAVASHTAEERVERLSEGLT